jgi:hypothetical protein
MKIGKREQKRIDKALLPFFAMLTLSKNGETLLDAFKAYLAKHGLIINEEKTK